MAPRDRNNMSDEDRALWRRVAETVTRSRVGRNLPDAPSDDNAIPPKQPEKQAVPSMPAPPSVQQGPARTRGPSGRTLDRRTEQRLRQGKLLIDETIDLHGLGQEAAHNLLKNRLVSAQRRGKRVILVITGKGLRSSMPGGILRQSLTIWCEMPPLSSIILKRVTAQPRDGGSGAFYIYLRRDR